MTVDISRKAAAAVSSVHAGVCVRPTEDPFQPPEFVCVCCSLGAAGVINQIFGDSGDSPVSSVPHSALFLPPPTPPITKMLRSHSFSLPFLVTWAVQLFLPFRLSHVSSVRPAFSQKCQIDIAATRLLIFTNAAAKSVGDSP